MARPKITLYLDTISPFAYIAYYILRHDAVFKDVDITYVPILLGGLIHKCGGKPPLEIKNKDKWINTERLRWSSHFSVPMTVPLPPSFPPPASPPLTLTILRALVAISQSTSTTPSLLPKALDVLLPAYWVDRQPTFDPAVLTAVLADRVFDGDQAAADRVVQQDARTSQVKQLLVANTERAYEDGAFGVPWMVCTDREGRSEGFWGVDHLGQVARFLGLEVPGGGSGSGSGSGSQTATGGWKAVL
ncbi:thioredoxin-like protein [Bombardia bombarda]|uniref:Glutathione S-transferase kappa n=1 Tax=Bombardia bombarda TaxID=252184 RepID=A0AA39XJD9_9PEZI|nr:thioredoxin-like protein [Bombardia bombarda]